MEYIAQLPPFMKLEPGAQHLIPQLNEYCHNSGCRHNKHSWHKWGF